MLLSKKELMISDENLKKKKFNSLKFKNELIGWGFISIPTIMIFTFFFYPMFQSFILSLQTGIGGNLEFVGFDNYVRMLQDTTFITAVRNTFTFLIIQVPLMVLLALIISVALNNKNLKGRSFFRTAIFLPAITSLVAYATVFRSLFGPQGIINAVLMNLSIISEPMMWLSDPTLARITVIIAITWRWTGYNMIFYLSALQNVDESIYEAARIDGASAIQQFFNITIPLLKPVILFTSITSTIGTLQLFDEVVSLTQGGPGNATLTISQYIYNLMFRFTPDFGYAATISYAIVVMIIALSIIQFKVAGDK